MRYFSFLILFGCFQINQIVLGEVEDIELTVVAKNIKSNTGSIMIALVDNESDFPDAKVTPLKTKIPAKKGEVLFLFKGIKSGKYAVAVYQDLNGNEKLDTNFFGIPSEPFGVSGSPKFGKPKFGDCALEINQSTKVEVNLNN
jgi:uncharacterized protein (DUF2141 family)